MTSYEKRLEEIERLHKEAAKEGRKAAKAAKAADETLEAAEDAFASLTIWRQRKLNAEALEAAHMNKAKAAERKLSDTVLSSCWGEGEKLRAITELAGLLRAVGNEGNECERKEVTS